MSQSHEIVTPHHTERETESFKGDSSCWLTRGSLESRL